MASQANPLIHVLALALVVLGLAALSALQQRGQQPIWYMLALVAITPMGVLAGGLVRLRFSVFCRQIPIASVETKKPPSPHPAS